MFPVAVMAAGCSLAENWPCWRGPRLDGTSLETNVPVVWGATERASHFAWKTALSGTGHASPIVWEDAVFVVAATGNEEERQLIRIDRDTGAVRWQVPVVRTPPEGKHDLNSRASSTPATDGTLVFTAFLAGSEMVVSAHDFSGRQVWQVRPGTFSSRHGFCSSPVVFEDLLLVNGDHDGDSYLLGLERATGRTRWKTPRENHTRSYCVPLVRELAGRTQMILSGDKQVASYDPRTGRRHWVIQGPTEQFVASLVYNPEANLLFLTGGFPDLHLLGIRPDGSGDVTATHVSWRANKGVSYVPSPISFGPYFLIASDGGMASCYRAADGTLVWQERLGPGEHASLVSAGGLVHFLGDDGVTTVVRPGEKYEKVARNELGERCFASPAISGGRVFLRGDHHLFCVGP